MEYQLLTLEDADRNLTKYEAEQVGLENYIQKQIDYLDVSRVLAENTKFRIIQTIDYLYKVTISKTHYAISLVEDLDERKVWLHKLAERHRANIEYEKENPPLVYKKKSATKSKKANSPVEKSKPKETVAQQKLKQRAIKLGTLKLKMTNGKSNSV